MSASTIHLYGPSRSLIFGPANAAKISESLTVEPPSLLSPSPTNLSFKEKNPLHLRVGAFINWTARLSPKLAGWMAIQLFKRPRRLSIDDKVAAFLAQAEALTLRDKPRIEGYRWHAEQHGAQPLRVLLVHGWESNAGRWNPLIRELLDSGAVITAFDGPAAGRSGGRNSLFNEYVRLAKTFEESFGPFDAYVGHSLGAGVVAQLATRVELARRPKSMVLMASFDESEHVFARYHAMLGFNDRVCHEFNSRISHQLSDGLTVQDYSNVRAVRQLSGIRGLVVHSVDDYVSPICEGEALHAAWPNSEMFRYEDEGHALKGEELERDIARWLVNPTAS